MFLERFVKNRLLREVLEWALTIIAAFVLFLLVQTYAYRNADVDGDSMSPTLIHQDKVIINLMSYWLSEPERGDIIVFPYKERPSDLFIKRIIGLPGDIIDMIDYEFYVNNEPLDDAFSYNKIVSLGNIEFPVEVPEDSYFVLGDNRNGSRDSRFTDVGFIAKKEILGKVSLRIWPLSKAGIIE